MNLPDNEYQFPPVTSADAEGLLAIGGDLSASCLLTAYRNGIFPWFTDDVLPMWWCPDPRFVLFPNELKISKSMHALLKKGHYQFRYNTQFEAVITNCQQIHRPGQDGTWITKGIIDAYTELHGKGYAVSAEAWQGDTLAGGLYGIRLGKLFFGESMFSLQPNASKFALIQLIRYLSNEGLQLIDCQVYTEHLERLGARMIPRDLFLQYVHQQ